MHCQAKLPRTATYFDTRTQVPTTPQGREPAARRSCCPAAPSFLPLRRSCAPVRVSPGCRGLVWAGLWLACGKHKTMFQDDTSKAERTACGSIAHAWRCRPVHTPACCAAAFPSNECPQASALASQTCAASRRAFSTCFTIRALLSQMPAHGPTGFQMHCQAELPRTATYFDTRTQVPTTPQEREPAARRSCCAAAPSFLPVEAQLRPRAGASWLQGPCVGRARACLRQTQNYVSR